MSNAWTTLSFPRVEGVIAYKVYGVYPEPIIVEPIDDTTTTASYPDGTVCVNGGDQ